MSSSNEIQANPVETSTLQQAEAPAVQPTTLEIITNTNNNSNTADDEQQMECRCSGIWDFFLQEDTERGGTKQYWGTGQQL